MEQVGQQVQAWRNADAQVGDQYDRHKHGRPFAEDLLPSGGGSVTPDELVDMLVYLQFCLKNAPDHLRLPSATEQRISNALLGQLLVVACIHLHNLIACISQRLSCTCAWPCLSPMAIET